MEIVLWRNDSVKRDKMCELCENYGDGDRWYLNPENYGRPLYKKVEEDEKKDTAASSELQLGKLIKSMIDLKEEDEEAFQSALEDYSENARKNSVGQVITLEDGKKMAEISQPIAKMDCLCRRISRATFEDGDDRPRSCLGTGVGLFRWEEMPERYKGGIEFISTEEAKEHLEKWHERGMVVLIMTFGTPYIGGLCLCDYPDCLAIRMRMDYGTMNLLKGHEVAKVDYDKCTGCGTCAQRCQFDAIKMEVTMDKANIDMTKCFGCGVCEYSCPQDAINLVERESLPALKDEW